MSQATLECAINSHSLEITRGEIKRSLQDSSAAFEIFLSDATDQDALARCAENLRQLDGALNVIDLRGPEIIARDLREVADSLVVGETELVQNRLAALGTGILALERFVDFIQSRQKDVPVLAVESANTIRKSCGMPLLFESICVDSGGGRFTSESQLAFAGAASDPAAASALAADLLVHYQRGLIAVMGGDTASIHLQAMTRVMKRICLATPAGPWQRFWFLAYVVLYCFQHRGLVMLDSRKLALVQLEGLLRALAADSAFTSQPVPESLEGEFSYLLGINTLRSGPAAAFIELAQIPLLDPDDSQLSQWLEQLRGPSAGTVQSVLGEVRSELGQAVDLLEVVAKRDVPAVEELQKLSELIARCCSVLRVVNLELVANSLDEQSQRLGAITMETSAEELGDTCMQAADVFLRVDSYLERFTEQRGGDGTVAASEGEFMQEMQSQSNPYIGEARALATEELRVGIARVKGLVAEQVSAGTLAELPADVAETLQELCGVSLLLGLKRANGVIDACRRFAEDIGQLASLPENTQAQRMTTFADVLVSIEYYLEDFAVRNQADSSVLEIAEDSLQVLGYPVAA